MATDDWKKTACILCYANCGLEVQTEGRRITKVKGDKAHPRSSGYVCQKASRITYYQNETERLTSPLRRRSDGTFEEIDWKTACAEIAEKMLALRERYGPRSLGHYGGGGQGNHSGGGYGIMMMRALGATDFYSSIAQEKSGRFWVNGRMFGAQNCNHAIQAEEADLLIVLGGSIWQAQCEPGARTHLKEASKADGKKIIVVDPVRTRDAEFADLHLQIKPGTDTYLLGAMLKLLLDTGGFDREFITEHTEGWETVASEIAKIPANAWIAHTGLSQADVETAVRMIIDADAMTLRTELGIEMGRNSTLNSYLGNLLFLATGNFGRPGTHGIHTWLQPLIGNSKGARSLVTGMEEIMGVYPPNRFAEEVLSDNPERLRAMLIDSSNPANSAANTVATEAALRALEMLVVVDVAMTETACLADYVLPAASQYEKWEFTYFTFSFPTNYFHLRRPLFEPLEGTRVEAEIYADLARRMGLLPDASRLEDLAELTGNDRAAFATAFKGVVRENLVFSTIAPLILYLTIGKSLTNGAASAAILWPACHRIAARNGKAVQRAIKSDRHGPALGEALFDRILDSPSGTPFTHNEFDDVWDLLAFPDHKIRMHVPEMLDWLDTLDPAEDVDDADYPFVVSLGQRRAYNANQIIRTPKWRNRDIDGNLRMHPLDLLKIGVAGGGWVTVETRTGKLTARAEADDSLRTGYATLPHGYGMTYPLQNGERISIGPRINMLSASDDCDPIGATPYHKNVAARLRCASDDEAGMSEAVSMKVRAYITADRA
jgi:anaerobic selenocysteine-containing dehydrogenase